MELGFISMKMLSRCSTEIIDFTVVFDYGKFKILSIEEDFVTSGFNCTMTPLGIDFTFQYENFRGKFLAASNAVILDGSIHKFMRGGYNYDDFTYKDLKAALKKIADKFETTLDKIEIASVEVGVNLIMPLHPRNYYNCFKSYGSNSYIKMNPLPGTSAINGIRCCGCSRTIKLYNKTVDAKRKARIKVAVVPENIIRIEVRLTSNFITANKLSYTALDLMKEAVFLKYLTILDDSFNKSIKVNEYSIDDLKGLKTKTIRDYFFICSDKYADYKEGLKLSKTGLKQENIRCKKTIEDVEVYVGKAGYVEELEIAYTEKRKQLLM
jgi:hypothetical protein